MLFRRSAPDEIKGVVTLLRVSWLERMPWLSRCSVQSSEFVLAEAAAVASWWWLVSLSRGGEGGDGNSSSTPYFFFCNRHNITHINKLLLSKPAVCSQTTVTSLKVTFVNFFSPSLFMIKYCEWMIFVSINKVSTKDYKK